MDRETRGGSPPITRDDAPKKVDEVKAEELHFDANAFDRVSERVNSTMSDGGMAPALRRRCIYVTIHPEMCIPGTFDKPVRVGMVELNTEREKAVTASVEKDGSGGAGLSFSLAVESLDSLNGRKLAGHEKSQLWEWIGFGGRSTLAQAFMENCCGFDADLQARSLASVEIA
jgi:hypothetical protein